MTDLHPEISESRNEFETLLSFRKQVYHPVLSQDSKRTLTCVGSELLPSRLATLSTARTKRNRKATPASSQKVHSSKNDSPFISCTNLYGPPFVASGFDAAEVGEGEESPDFEGEGEGGGELGVFDFGEEGERGESLPDDEADAMGFDCAKKSREISQSRTQQVLISVLVRTVPEDPLPPPPAGLDVDGVELADSSLTLSHIATATIKKATNPQTINITRCFC